MKVQTKTLLYIALVAAAISPVFAQTVPSDPVGFRTERIVPGFNLLSPNLDNKIGAAGAIDVVEGTALTDNDVDFVAAFTHLSPEAPNPWLTLQLTSGPNPGVVADVTSFTAKTLTTAQDISSLVTPGTQYEVRGTETLASLFGSNDEAGLQKGEGDDKADVIWVPRGEGRFDRYYYHTGYFWITSGWKRVGGGNIDCRNAPISFTDGILIQGRGATPLDITFTGFVRTVEPTVVIEGNAFTYLSRVVPVPLALAESRLETALQHGSDATADLVWNPRGDGSYDRYYYLLPNPFFAGGWKRVGGGNTDQSAVELKSAFIVQRRAPGDINFTLGFPSGFSP